LAIQIFVFYFFIFLRFNFIAFQISISFQNEIYSKIKNLNQKYSKKECKS